MSPLPSRIITRNRQRLACKECRRRKLKCDRLSPCSSCVRRGDEASCTYQRPADAAGQILEQRGETQARLERLEQLVQQLATQPSIQSNGSSTTSTPPLGTVEATTGTEDSDGVSYKGSSHWSAMLDDIHELKLAIPFDDILIPDSYTDGETEGCGIELLFGGGAPLPFDVVISSYLPPRQEVDRMISAYFRAEAIAAPFIHTSQFRRMYQQFWLNPSQCSPLWISILFSICHIASNTLRRNNTEEQPSTHFSFAAANCLVIGQYFKPKRYAVEALTLFTQSQCLVSNELPPDIGPLIGLIIRLATRMGYHRDPEHFRLSPFDKEMRRRTWSFCMQLDLIISFHLGQPTSVQFPTWDTKIPQALLDSEFDEDSLQLPPPHPDSEINHMSFYLAKHKFMAVFEKILRHTLSTNPDPFELEKLDGEIRAEFAALPELLKPRPMSDSVVDSANLIVTRLCVSFVYCKCLCVLHRPYATHGRTESITICYEVASHLVGDFVDAFYEFAEGGQAETEKWFLSAITWHDFLFGIMALCLVLCIGNSRTDYNKIEVKDCLNILEKAKKLCSEQESRRHKDTKRVLVLVNAVIARFGAQDNSNNGVSILEPSDIDPETVVDNDSIWHSTWEIGESATGLAQDPSWGYFEQLLDFDTVI